MKNKYPKWIDEYAKAFHNGFVDMVPLSWGPVDAYIIFSLLNGSFLAKVYEAISVLKENKVSIDKIANSFSNPSTLRCAIYFLIIEYQKSNPKNKKQFKEIIEFFVNILKHMMKSDTFAYKSNICHSSQEIKRIINTTKWIKANKDIAREIGKLYNSLSSLVYSLYRDFFPQESCEIYGPYKASKFGKNAILLIKHFPKIKPVDLWPESKNFKYKDIKIFQVYKNVKFKCEIIGMHSIYKGDLINNLVAFAVMVDGKYVDIKKIKKLSNYFAEVATEQSTVYDKFSKEELKKKILEWECYQFFDFFKLAGMDWKPTKEMIATIKNKKVDDRFEMEKFPSFKEFITNPKYEVYWLKNLYNQKN